MVDPPEEPGVDVPPETTGHSVTRRGRSVSNSGLQSRLLLDLLSRPVTHLIRPPPPLLTNP